MQTCVIGVLFNVENTSANLYLSDPGVIWSMFTCAFIACLFVFLTIDMFNKSFKPEAILLVGIVSHCFIYWF